MCSHYYLKSVEFWRNYLATLKSGSLISKDIFEGSKSYVASVIPVSLSSEVQIAVSEYAHRIGSSMYVVVLACIQCLLFKSYSSSGIYIFILTFYFRYHTWYGNIK